MTIQRIGLLLVPHEGVFSILSDNTLPSLTLAILTGYLVDAGFSADQFDLNCAVRDKGLAHCPANFSFIFSKQVVLDYLNGAENSDIDSLLTKLLADVTLEHYDLIGISVGADVSVPQLHMGFVLGKYIQKHFPGLVVFGGGNITYLCLFRDVFSELLSTATQNFDYIVRGPGTRPLVQLIGAINGGASQDHIHAINGLVWIDADRQVRLNPIDLPQVLRPNFDGVQWEHYQNYFLALTGDVETDREAQAHNLADFYGRPYVLANALNAIRKHRQDDQKYEKKPILLYMFNHFCPYKCAFCGESTTTSKIVTGTVEQVVDDLAYLAAKHDTDHFIFVNNAMNSSPRFADGFCAEIKRRQLRLNWSDCARFNNLTFERLERLKEAGCRKLVFGFETGSPRLLGLIDKQLDLTHAEQVLRWCHQLGIYADLEVIVGLPWENDEDFQATYDFCLRNKSYISFLWINTYFVIPNSLLGQCPERYQIEIRRDVRTYDSLMEDSYAWFQKTRGITTEPVNYHDIYKYDEIGGDDYITKSQVTKARLAKLRPLNQEFATRYMKMVTTMQRMGIPLAY